MFETREGPRVASPVPGQRGERCGGAGLGWRAFPGEKTLRNFLAQNWPRLLFLKPKMLGPAGMAPEGAVEGAAPARPPGTNATAFPDPVPAQLSPHKPTAFPQFSPFSTPRHQQ